MYLILNDYFYIVTIMKKKNIKKQDTSSDEDGPFAKLNQVYHGAQDIKEIKKHKELKNKHIKNPTLWDSAKANKIGYFGLNKVTP